MSLSIYNTLTRQKEEFKPIESGKVSMYVCGPTVYADAHIGHAMSSIIFDMVHRYLEYRDFEVCYAINFTDVDDKIIRRAQEAGKDPFELANHFANKYLVHLEQLNVLSADIYPRVTAEIDTIIQLIQELGEEGYVYNVDGDVYFRVRNDDDYGKLSNRSLDAAVTGTRVEEDGRKESPHDFALWKSAKPDEPFWPSPWGPGRPGWHIECSAMCLKHLGETIDIHGGGNDLIFPHHENEIAQSESATGKSFARYWMHNGMMQLSGEKMSKSLGNVILIDEYLQDHTPDALRLLIFSGHYRKPVMFSEEALCGAERSLARLQGGLRPASGNTSTGPDADTLREATEQARNSFIQAMDDDFNTSIALASLFELVRAINTARSANVSGPFYHAAQKTLRELAGVLGLTLESSDATESSSSIAAKPFIDLLIQVRSDLRAAKQWALADQIRAQLKELGVSLEDSAQGTTWRFDESNE
ncbi:cysteine--tRNA ligase [Chloroflexi bacterium TSY]|nr:cysteine--tRNA ligase [Chloroflexi bacterium TSY]